jgi:hypothetical protein
MSDAAMQTANIRIPTPRTARRARGTALLSACSPVATMVAEF